MGEFGEKVVVAKGILARLLFAGHMLVSIWMVVQVTGCRRWWSLTLGLAAYVSDVTLLTSSKSNSRYLGFKRNVICMVVYLVTVIGAVWGTEMALNQKLQTHHTFDRTTYILGELHMCSHVDCVKAVEQLTPCMAIFGRWLLPKGEISRDEFSNLLLVFLGVAADIFEFMEVLNYPKVFEQRSLVQIIVALWGWSLLQFVINVPGSKKKVKYTEQLLRQTFQAKVSTSNKRGGVEREDAFQYVAEHVEMGKKLADAVKARQMALFEVAVIFANVTFQDAPYFAFRLYASLTHPEINTASHIFFTMKNGLVIVLQLYRLLILAGQVVKYRSHQHKFKRELRNRQTLTHANLKRPRKPGSMEHWNHCQEHGHGHGQGQMRRRAQTAPSESLEQVKLRKRASQVSWAPDVPGPAPAPGPEELDGTVTQDGNIAKSSPLRHEQMGEIAQNETSAHSPIRASLQPISEKPGHRRSSRVTFQDEVADMREAKEVEALVAIEPEPKGLEQTSENIRINDVPMAEPFVEQASECCENADFGDAECADLEEQPALHDQAPVSEVSSKKEEVPQVAFKKQTVIRLAEMDDFISFDTE